VNRKRSGLSSNVILWHESQLDLMCTAWSDPKQSFEAFPTKRVFRYNRKNIAAKAPNVAGPLTIYNVNYGLFMAIRVILPLPVRV
jgi:hypothetical protein